MAVPTIYVKLIEEYDNFSFIEKSKIKESCKKLRLMVSGSAALPIPVFNRWKTITGHYLLERYGMTEIGMAISNPYNGKRIPGYVGKPFSEVSIKLVSESKKVIKGDGIGEIYIKGKNVFKEYYNKINTTK